jgi:hypothetical protein
MLDLPTEEAFSFDEHEWIFQLISNVPEKMRAMILLLLWRVWHYRNNVVHGDGKARVSASVPYLCSYLQSYASASGRSWDMKGKTPVILDRHIIEGKPEQPRWLSSTEGELKANVDAGWNPTSKEAGIRIALRDHRGHPIIMEWKFVPACASAKEAEVIACLEGLRLLISLQRWPASLEFNYIKAVHAITNETEGRSASWALILEARELLKISRDITISKVDRVATKWRMP